MRKRISQFALFITGTLMIGYGAIRGEAATVLGKAIKLCLECVELDKKQLYDQKSSPGTRVDSAAATLLTNIHIPNLFKGKIYRGNAKTVCVPGLNCYSCPAAAGACPIGAFRAVVGSSNFKFSYYITGFFILLGVTLGRFICGFYVLLDGFRICFIKSPEKIFYGQAKAFEIPEVHHSYRFRYSTADACDELHRNGRSVFL